MTTFIILIMLTAVGVYWFIKSDYDNILSFMSIIVFGIMLLLHSYEYFTVKYQYELFVQERNAFEQTLAESRSNGNVYETAAIVKEVANWNQQLAKYKFKNKTVFFDQYIDDRIELLEFVK